MTARFTATKSVEWWTTNFSSSWFIVYGLMKKSKTGRTPPSAKTILPPKPNRRMAIQRKKILETTKVSWNFDLSAIDYLSVTLFTFKSHQKLRRISSIEPFIPSFPIRGRQMCWRRGKYRVFIRRLTSCCPMPKVSIGICIQVLWINQEENWRGRAFRMHTKYRWWKRPIRAARTSHTFLPHALLPSLLQIWLLFAS